MSAFALSFVTLLGRAAAGRYGAPAAVPSWACSVADAPKLNSSGFDPSLPPWGAMNATLNFHVLNNTAKEQRVTAVDATSLHTLMTEGQTGLLVVFYAPWCPHCHDFVIKGGDEAPIEILNNDLIKDDGPKVVKFNTQKSSVPSNFDVQFIPTIFAVPAGGAAVKFSGDPHNIEQLKSFAKSKSTSSVTTVLASKGSSHKLRK